nr:FHA domain-containing protein [Cohnella lubricantis]
MGRSDSEWEPDVAFDNAFVSRRQAAIDIESGSCSIMDLDSKHGTQVNGNPLTPFVPALLGSSDRVSFAGGMVILTFSPVRTDETLEFTPVVPTNDFLRGDYKLDPIRQTIRLGEDLHQLSDKEYRCLELLVRKERQFVGREEIIRYVWPERAEADLQSAASTEEINSLLYRIRKKTNHTIFIENIRGKGYILQEITPGEYG